MNVEGNANDARPPRFQYDNSAYRRPVNPSPTSAVGVIYPAFTYDPGPVTLRRLGGEADAPVIVQVKTGED